jgi:hypothetical protein
MSGSTAASFARKRLAQAIDITGFGDRHASVSVIAMNRLQ